MGLLLILVLIKLCFHCNIFKPSSTLLLFNSSTLDESKRPKGENAFVLEELLYDCEISEAMKRLLENLKIIATQRDAMFSAMEFPMDHPVEKALRAIIAPTLMHLDLGKKYLLELISDN